jgi:hypothetical protein
MTALGEVFAVLACTDMRAALAGLSDLMGRLVARPSKIRRARRDKGLTRLTPPE